MKSFGGKMTTKEWCPSVTRQGGVGAEVGQTPWEKAPEAFCRPGGQVQRLRVGGQVFG